MQLIFSIPHPIRTRNHLLIYNRVLTKFDEWTKFYTTIDEINLEWEKWINMPLHSCYRLAGEVHNQSLLLMKGKLAYKSLESGLDFNLRGSTLS
mgnify:CR=1 FL=1